VKSEFPKCKGVGESILDTCAVELAADKQQQATKALVRSNKIQGRGMEVNRTGSEETAGIVIIGYFQKGCLPLPCRG
jgi:hypothetical protein